MRLSADAALRALIIGAAFAAQVGPIAVFCMRRTIGSGWRAGMVVGLGIATADAIYALLAASGMVGISRLLAEHAEQIHLAAAAVMIGLGFTLLLRAREPEPPAVVSGGRYLESVALTLTNPMTIVAYAAAIGVLAPLNRFDAGTAVSSVIGVFAGSLLWWLFLVSAVARFRLVLGGRARRAIDKFSALLLIGFGIKIGTTK